MLPILPHTFLILASGLSCPSVTPQISVQMVQEPTNMVRSMTREQLTRMKQGDGNTDWKLESENIRVNGLGGGALTLSGTIRFSMYGDDKNACIAVQSIEGKIAVKPEIHIASNFRRGTCEYDAVLEHEEKHVQVLRDFAVEYKERFRAELTRLAKRAGNDGLMPRAQLKPAQERKHQIIAGGITDYGRTLMSLLEQRQLTLDTPAEYALVQGQCEGWEAPERIFPDKPHYNQ